LASCDFYNIYDFKIRFAIPDTRHAEKSTWRFDGSRESTSLLQARISRSRVSYGMARKYNSKKYFEVCHIFVISFSSQYCHLYVSSLRGI